MKAAARLLLRLVLAGLAAGALAAEPPTCLAPAAWTVLAGGRPRVATAGAVFADMAGRDVVLLGETHDDPDHHRWQLQALAALQAQRPDLVIGFEMFPRRVQPVLDRWVAGELTPAQLLAQTDWDQVWQMPAELYLPLFEFARINRIPMLALNVDHKFSRDVGERGWDAVPEAEREGVGRPAPPSQAYRAALLEIYRQHLALRGKDGAGSDDAAFRHFVESQTTWDRAMAEALARPAAARPRPPLVVGIMGSGHIRFGYGVPHQLSDLGVGKIGTLLPLAADADCGELRAGLADAVFALPPAAAAAAPPPRLGVRLEEGQDGVRIGEVLADSLAEKSGLKAGDRLLTVAGRPATRIALVTASVHRQPAGSWLPLQVRRGDQTMEVVVKFPPAP